MPIVLYQISSSPPCRAVVMTAEELGIELDKREVNLMEGEQMKPEFLAINPQHCVPTIDDDGFYLWESYAIMTYLVNKYAPDSKLYPKDPQQRALVDKMLYFDISTMHKTQTEYLRPVLIDGKAPEPEKEENFKKALTVFEELLGKTSYSACNHLTLADYSLLGTLSCVYEVGGYSLAPYPRITAWLEKLKAEIPHYKEINQEPLLKFKEFLDLRKK